MFGLAARLGAQTGAAHQPAAALDETHIAGDRHDVLDALGLQEGEDLGAGKAAVQPDPEDRPREGHPQAGEQAPQERDRAALGRAVARAQHRSDHVLRRLGIEGQRRHQGQVARGVVVPVEEAELLLPVGGIVGRIEVDRDAAGAAPEPRAMVLDDEVGQPEARQVELLPPHGVLEPGERRLGRQVGASERIAVDQELVDRVLRQSGRVVAVGVAGVAPVSWTGSGFRAHATRGRCLSS